MRLASGPLREGDADAPERVRLLEELREFKILRCSAVSCAADEGKSHMLAPCRQHGHWWRRLILENPQTRSSKKLCVADRQIANPHFALKDKTAMVIWFGGSPACRLTIWPFNFFRACPSKSPRTRKWAPPPAALMRWRPASHNEHLGVSDWVSVRLQNAREKDRDLRNRRQGRTSQMRER